MANRTFSQDNFSLIKRMVHIFTTIYVDGTTPTVRKWNYPTFGAGANARTYTVAPSASTLPSGAAWPLQYSAGAEGVYNVARTGTGLYTITLQDSYQRLMFVDGYAASAGGAPTFLKVTENSSITNMASSSPGSIIGLAFWDANAAAVDPVGPVRLMFILQDATES